MIKKRKARVGRRMKANLAKSIEQDKKERKERRKRNKAIREEAKAHAGSAFTREPIDPEIEAIAHRMRSVFNVRVIDLHTRTVDDMQRSEAICIIDAADIKRKILLTDEEVAKLLKRAITKLKKANSSLIEEGGYTW